jgi:hypothetical protein
MRDRSKEVRYGKQICLIKLAATQNVRFTKQRGKSLREVFDALGLARAVSTGFFHLLKRNNLLYSLCQFLIESTE